MKRTSKISAIVPLVCGLAVGLVILLVGGLVIGMAAQQKEVVFTYVTNQETMSFDPADYSDMTTSANIFNTHDPLVYPVKGKAPEPCVAESWKISEDGTTYTFYIRKAIKFHDGTDLTAEDVVFSLRRMLRLNLGFAWLWAGLFEPEDVEATDEYTVVFHLKKPFAPFMATLVQFHIVSKDLIMKEKKPGEFGKFGDYGREYLQTHDAGSGPYMVESVTLGDRIHFVKFEDYWKGWEENQIDEIHWLVIPEIATIKTMMLKGTADMCTEGLPPEMMEDLDKAPGINVVEKPSIKVFLTHMNNKKPPLDDVNVRKAISYAIDYEAVSTTVFPGPQAVGPVPPGVPGHNSNVVVYSRDLEKAKQFLEKSKYSMEELKQMKLTFVYVSYVEMFRKLALLFNNSLADIGLTVDIQSEVWGRLCDMATKPETTPHLACMWVSAKYPTADYHTVMMYTPRGWKAYPGMSWYENPEVTELVQQARLTVDPEERYRLYGKAQRIITEDSATVWLTNPPLRRPMQTYVKGFRYPGVLSYDLDFYSLRIKNGR